MIGIAAAAHLTLPSSCEDYGTSLVCLCSAGLQSPADGCSSCSTPYLAFLTCAFVALDSSRLLMGTAAVANLAGISSHEDKAFLRNRFVTGDWGEGHKRAQARPRREGEEVRLHHLSVHSF